MFESMAEVLGMTPTGLLQAFTLLCTAATFVILGMAFWNTHKTSHYLDHSEASRSRIVPTHRSWCSLCKQEAKEMTGYRGGGKGSSKSCHYCNGPRPARLQVGINRTATCQPCKEIVLECATESMRQAGRKAIPNLQKGWNRGEAIKGFRVKPSSPLYALWGMNE